MLSDLEVADALDRAADLYESEQYDWCQGKYEDFQPSIISICASTALGLAVGLPRWCVNKVERAASRASPLEEPYYRVRETVLRHIENQYFGPSALPIWNDEKGRTKQEVIDLFKDTAKELRNAA